MKLNCTPSCSLVKFSQLDDELGDDNIFDADSESDELFDEDVNEEDMSPLLSSSSMPDRLTCFFELELLFFSLCFMISLLDRLFSMLHIILFGIE